MPTSAKDDIWSATILNKILITIIKKTWSNLSSKFTFRSQVYYWHLQHQFSSEYMDFLNLTQTDWSYFSVCCRKHKGTDTSSQRWSPSILTDLCASSRPEENTHQYINNRTHQSAIFLELYWLLSTFWGVEFERLGTGCFCKSGQ